MMNVELMHDTYSKLLDQDEKLLLYENNEMGILSNHM